MLTNLLGLAPVTFFAASVLVLILRRGLRPGAQLAMMAAFCVALLIPCPDLPLAAYLRGAIGDPSVTTITVLVAALLPAGSPTSRQFLPAWWLLIVGGVVLYPLALGAGAIDSYRWGFGEPLFVLVILAIGLIAWGFRWPLIALAIPLAVIAWSLGIYESRNLWDYLIDPLLVLYALCAVLPHVLWRRIKAPRA